MKRSEIAHAQAQAHRQFAKTGLPLHPALSIEMVGFRVGCGTQQGLAPVARVTDAEYCGKRPSLRPNGERRWSTAP